MTGANLYNTDLTETKVSEKILKDTILYKTIMPSGKRNDSDCNR